MTKQIFMNEKNTYLPFKNKVKQGKKSKNDDSKN